MRLQEFLCSSKYIDIVKLLCFSLFQDGGFLVEHNTDEALKAAEAQQFQITKGLPNMDRTPPSMVLPNRTVLVAKRLSLRDKALGTIYVPRAAVNANFSFMEGYTTRSLLAKDHLGVPWEFELQRYPKRDSGGLGLKNAGPYIKKHQLQKNDVVAISSAAVS